MNNTAKVTNLLAVYELRMNDIIRVNKANIPMAPYRLPPTKYKLPRFFKEIKDVSLPSHNHQKSPQSTLLLRAYQVTFREQWDTSSAKRNEGVDARKRPEKERKTQPLLIPLLLPVFATFFISFLGLDSLSTFDCRGLSESRKKRRRKGKMGQIRNGWDEETAGTRKNWGFLRKKYRLDLAC